MAERGDTRFSHSHLAAVIPESLRPSLSLGARDAPWENGEIQGPVPPTWRRTHLSPSGPAWAAWGIGAPYGRTRRHKVQPLPHSGGYTRVPLVLPGLLAG